jgi:hypothetical protein
MMGQSVEWIWVRPFHDIKGRGGRLNDLTQKIEFMFSRDFGHYYEECTIVTHPLEDYII